MERPYGEGWGRGWQGAPNQEMVRDYKPDANEATASSSSTSSSSSWFRRSWTPTTSMCGWMWVAALHFCPKVVRTMKPGTNDRSFWQYIGALVEGAWKMFGDQHDRPSSGKDAVSSHKYARPVARKVSRQIRIGAETHFQKLFERFELMLDPKPPN